MELPSKELLSAVTELDVAIVDKIEDGILYISDRYDFTEVEINIYELMHMMKQWADERGYWIDSGKHSKGWEANYVNKDLSSQLSGYMLCDTEFEAVTKACEWILKESK